MSATPVTLQRAVADYHQMKVGAGQQDEQHALGALQASRQTPGSGTIGTASHTMPVKMEQSTLPEVPANEADAASKPQQNNLQRISGAQAANSAQAAWNDLPAPSQVTAVSSVLPPTMSIDGASMHRTQS